MTKRILMLSAATAALLAGPAFADTEISNTAKDAVTTSSDGNITIDAGDGVVISKADAAAVTIDSDNFVSSLGVISNKADQGTAIDIDISKNPNATANSANTGGLGIDIGDGATIDMSGSGGTKRAVWLDSANLATAGLSTGSFTGPITFESGSTINLQGDDSIGILADSTSVLNGSITQDGILTLTATTDRSTTASNLIGMELDGTVNGNVENGTTGEISVSGQGAEGVVITGDIDCATAGCATAPGSFANYGIIAGAGQTSVVETSTGEPIYTGNPESGLGLAIGGNVAGGIYNGGPLVAGDSVNPAAAISVTGSAPAVEIVETANRTAGVTIGVFAADTTDPGFSFYNRGSITSSLVNLNENSVGLITGGLAATEQQVFTGGFFNSGTITASATSYNGHGPGVAVDANAVTIGDYTVLGENLAAKNAGTGAFPSLTNVGDQAAFVNSNLTGAGTISASVGGPMAGSQAEALIIKANAVVPSLINSGAITATATTTDLTITPVTSSSNVTLPPLQAEAIVDLSGTLKSIVNTGTISATATAVDDGLEVANAIDLSNGAITDPAGTGVTIVDQGTAAGPAAITGNVLFGAGDNQVLDVAGVSATNTGSIIGNIEFGSSSGGASSGDQLTVGHYGVVKGIVVAPSGVAVDVQNQGVLVLDNAENPLNASSFNVETGGAVSLTVSEALTTNGMVQVSGTAPGSATIAHGATLGVAYGSFIPASANANGQANFVLISAPHGALSVDATTLADDNQALTKNIADGGSLPFLFQAADLEERDNVGGQDQLVLNVTPKTLDQLGLTGYAAQMFPLANQALSHDDALGAAMVNGITSAKTAQAAYAAFAPNVTGGSRAIAISITDQATGPVGARERSLLMYANKSGSATLWGQEFAQMIKDPGQGATDIEGTREQSGYKDHGFGFALGLDGGTPRTGWYGGAFTFYSGDVGELARDSHTNQQWYILSGYSVWRGKGLFLDTKLDVGYGDVDGKRFIDLTIPGTGTYTREADNKHGAELLSGGVTTGAVFQYGAATFMPQLSFDGLIMREEGYTETNPTPLATGDGFDLAVQPYYAQSLRAFVGADVRYDLNLWDFYLQPEARAGYRYDLFGDPVKLKAAFVNGGGLGIEGPQFTVQGPDPAQGNFVLGGSLAATTDAWTLGVHFDFVRGTNGVTQQVGTINLLGRI